RARPARRNGSVSVAARDAKFARAADRRTNFRFGLPPGQRLRLRARSHTQCRTPATATSIIAPGCPRPAPLLDRRLNALVRQWLQPTRLAAARSPPGQLMVRFASGLSSEKAGIAMSKRSPLSVTIL